ncbi:MAG: hypothetical protein R3C59_17905 [Planctomycetaceae bacterium]
MKTIVMGLTGLLVFGAALAGGWYAKTEILAPPVTDTEPEAPVDVTSDPIMDPKNGDGDGGASALMPVAVRDDAMSVEELLRFSLSLKERERVLRQEEEEFQQRRIQQQLVLNDIKTEQQVIADLRTKVDERLGSAQGMVDELNRLRDTVIVEREKSKEEFAGIESKQIEVSEQYKVNDKKLSTWLQGMSAEKSAEVLKEMANDGNIKTAVQLLANFEEREAAKILDAFEDPKLLNDFITEFRNLKTARTSSQQTKPRGN